MPKLTKIARSRIIMDILRYWIEKMQGQISDTQLKEICEKLDEKSDAELRKYWYDTVGEWLSRRGTKDIDKQFDKLIKGEKRNYSYEYS